MGHPIMFAWDEARFTGDNGRAVYVYENTLNTAGGRHTLAPVHRGGAPLAPRINGHLVSGVVGGKLAKALWHVGRGEPFDAQLLFDTRRLAIDVSD